VYKFACVCRLVWVSGGTNEFDCPGKVWGSYNDGHKCAATDGGRGERFRGLGRGNDAARGVTRLNLGLAHLLPPQQVAEERHGRRQWSGKTQVQFSVQYLRCILRL